MADETDWTRRMARFSFWLGVLLIGALALAGCTQPQASPSPTAAPSASPSAYSGDLGSVDAADAQFGEFASWSGELESTGDVDYSDFEG